MAKLNHNVKPTPIRTIGELKDSLDRFPRETEVRLIASFGEDTEFYGLDIINMVDNLGVEIGSTEQLESN